MTYDADDQPAPYSLFADLRFDGERFEHANLPLDVLDNVAAYLEILRELAAEIWREKNPERERLPRSFRQNLSLSLTGVKDGSARAQVARDPFQDSRQLSDDYAIDYLALAQSRFLEVAAAANENRPIHDLPQSLRKPLQVIIGGLGAGEHLELISLSGKDTQRPNVTYSPLTRDRMISGIRKESHENISGIGIIRGIDDAMERIKILSEHGSFFYPVARNVIRRDLKSALNKFVEFEAFVRTSPSGGIAAVENGLGLKVAEEAEEYQRYEARIDHLETLEAGWRDGAGQELASQVIHYARDLGGFITTLYSGVAAFPTMEGGINIEFTHGNIEAAVMISPKMITIEAFDESDAEPRSQTFFGLSPKLLSHLLSLEDFVR
jgi:hypothetical protein